MCMCIHPLEGGALDIFAFCQGQPRDTAADLMQQLAEVVSRYIQPQSQSEAELEAARIEAEKALMADRVAQTARTSGRSESFRNVSGYFPAGESALKSP